MMKTRLNSVFLMAVLGSFAVPASASSEGGSKGPSSGDPAVGADKVALCTACHGPNGNSPVPMWPSLAGQHAEYLYKQLMDFKHGNRVNDQMASILPTIQEPDIPDIAAYYAQQQHAPLPAGPAPELGERIYRGGNPESGVAACTGCHGPKGLGLAAAKFPRLAGQHAQYVDSTLKYFRSATRANDPNGMMRGVADRMTDEEIAAVSQFIQGLAHQ